ncbi:ABC transporter permease [Paenibacillus sacheonensis]|uniref:ABC transporter permease subunit n=1 Tax=Paenibacillus sacheonensis TaxID=742054 RepID=A0A7X5C1S3_9BACL|nr:ABC transporter permease subunit [Paenibacillus sacheonensis]MBM7565362.1 putative aldouronate transport system permease protein [Paenibacillus sacheonensis]NBC69709.1 ABC transporter permease subunit [Paenibacillus sacheonensis]
MLKLMKKELPLHLMVWPALVIVLIYSYGPMLGIVIAFQKYVPAMGFFKSKWVGWDNFEYLLHLPNIWQVVGNTIYISAMKIIAGLIVPIVVALLLNEVRIHAFKRSVQTLVYLPHFLSWVILGGIVVDLLSPSTGLVNQLISWFGGKPIFFVSNNHWFPFILVSTDIWKEFGFSTIVYLAALTSINPALYEAAVMDGANRMRQTWHITLPGLLPVIILMATLSLGNVLNAGFDQVFNLYSPVVYQSGDILDTLVYRLGLIDYQYSVATAVGLLKSIVSLIFMAGSYVLAYRFANYRIF